MTTSVSGSTGVASVATQLVGSTSGTVTIQGAANAGTWTMTVPTTAGTSGYVLQTDGSGVTSWAALTGGGNVSNSGTPTAGQIAAWTNANTLQGITNLPVGNLNGGTGASSTTFWRGDGTWATPAGGGGVTWQSVQTANFTAVSGNAYPVNTTSAVITVTLPASPVAGNIVQLTDYAGTWGTNILIINPNGRKINSGTTNVLISTSRESIALVYVDSTQGWLAYSGFNTSTPVSTYSVSYLVIAGGGGGGLGGGGAGGLLSGTSSLTYGTTYSIVIGGGGSGAAATETKGGNGVSSSFNSIAPIGGGGGGAASSGAILITGASGGSGGGSGGQTSTPFTPGTGGSGTSGQGFAGGSGNNVVSAFGGGGGAGAIGSDGGVGTTVGGNGGAGAASSITGSSVTYAGGGGGEGGTTGGTGGAGGGGNGAKYNATTTSSTSGTANTGSGGGGGNASAPLPGSNGGSGVVILSMPTAFYSGTTTGSPTVTTSGSNTIIKFTASGGYTA